MRPTAATTFHSYFHTNLCFFCVDTCYHNSKGKIKPNLGCLKCHKPFINGETHTIYTYIFQSLSTTYSLELHINLCFTWTECKPYFIFWQCYFIFVVFLLTSKITVSKERAKCVNLTIYFISGIVCENIISALMTHNVPVSWWCRSSARTIL